MKTIKNLALLKSFLLICLLSLTLSACTQEDIMSDELKVSKWVGRSITGWRIEDGTKKYLSQQLGDKNGRFDLSFNGTNYIWNITSIAGLPDRSEIGIWTKQDKTILLSSSTGQNTIMTVEKVKRDLTDQLVLSWKAIDFEYSITFTTR